MPRVKSYKMNSTEEDKSKDPIILVDGSSYLYRAYHALPPLVTSKNQPTGAIRGVISMIKKILEDHPASPLGIILMQKEKHSGMKCLKITRRTDRRCPRTW